MKKPANRKHRRCDCHMQIHTAHIAKANQMNKGNQQPKPECVLPINAQAAAWLLLCGKDLACGLIYQNRGNRALTIKRKTKYTKKHKKGEKQQKAQNKS